MHIKVVDSAGAQALQQQLDLLSRREPAQQGLCALLNRPVVGCIETFDEAPLPLADHRLADINRVAASGLLH